MTPTRKPTSLLGVVAAGVLLGLPSIAAAQAQQKPKETPQTATPQRATEVKEVALTTLPTDGKLAGLEDLVGKTAFEFTLTDTEGAEHTLSDYLNDGRIVVLEWFNPQCPIVKRHYGSASTMNDLVSKYADKDVVWLAINSGSDRTGDIKLNEQARQNWSMAHPVLLDPTGDVGKAYGSKNTPTMYVIATDGTIAYGGGIDDDSRGSKQTPFNYVEAAVDALLVGSNIETNYAKPYGCGVKYPRR